MRTRFILDIEDMDVPTAFMDALLVIRQGKISKTSKGPQHCFLTRVGKTIVAVRKNKNSETFRIWREL